MANHSTELIDGPSNYGNYGASMLRKAEVGKDKYLWIIGAKREPNAQLRKHGPRNGAARNAGKRIHVFARAERIGGGLAKALPRRPLSDANLAVRWAITLPAWSSSVA